MGFFTKIATLFGSGATTSSKSAYPSEEYKGLIITPQPKSDNGQYRIAGLIEKPVEGEEENKQHYFIRSDTVGSADSAAELALLKCKNYIDQMGDRIFDQ
jgi:hypothetical protein